MAKSDDLVKYISKEVAIYIRTPKEARKSKENDKIREPWLTRWFGMIPMALGLWVKPKKKLRIK